MCRQCRTLLEQTSLPMSLGHCLMVALLQEVLGVSELLPAKRLQGMWEVKPGTLGFGHLHGPVEPVPQL